LSKNANKIQQAVASYELLKNEPKSTF